MPSSVSHLRRLAVVPDPPEEHPVLRLLSRLHSINGALRLQREALHHIKQARARGDEELEAAFEDVFRAAERAERAAR